MSKKYDVTDIATKESFTIEADYFILKDGNYLMVKVEDGKRRTIAGFPANNYKIKEAI